MAYYFNLYALSILCEKSAKVKLKRYDYVVYIKFDF